ncbi:hypothetical protein Baya_14553 [Bagarius yarrelli]|uniref:Secreted protein n=1 Tax=Bagarius yarrelli TaxID=175774 RepID=A0A556V9C3_BAGYA|nr:hypothetical protein Baya_14553 [Bagarius yarrelli]
MSWFLCLWIAISCLVLCQATLYETIQQHHVPRPGRNAIQILGGHESSRSKYRNLQVTMEMMMYQSKLLLKKAKQHSSPDQSESSILQTNGNALPLARISPPSPNCALLPLLSKCVYRAPSVLRRYSLHPIINRLCTRDVLQRRPIGTTASAHVKSFIGLFGSRFSCFLISIAKPIKRSQIGPIHGSHMNRAPAVL